ncbi:hypothetical protein [Bacillus sp. JCM 19034]|uniref:hypothetical protein n=1 Tax=Bacillus sp. JCM 19034 TaxID=1481928 RepID=UPI0007828DBD|nr:hypothetical protein [Bacillus sp. JCM 19034]
MIMKRKWLIMLLLIGMILVGCNQSEDVSKDGEGSDTNMEEEDVVGKEEEEVEKDVDTSKNEGEEELIGEEEVKTEVEVELDGKMEPLQLHVNKVDQETGVTIEDHPLYADINQLVTAEPEMGIPNDFSVVPLDIYIADGASSLFFLAINRLDVPLTNVSFELTLGNIDEEFVFDHTPIYLSEEEFGVLEPNYALPFFLDLTSEGEELYESLTMDNVFMDITNYSMDVIE